MRVMVTGGTGFVGAHTARALVDHGDELRLVVRRPEQVPASLGPVGVDPDRVEVVVAPVTDRAAMREAAGGCAAVVHAAAVFSFDPRDAEEMGRTNAAAARAVVGGALDAGAERVVHVSSTVALTPRRGGVVDRDSGPGDVPGTYVRSKVDSDLAIRALQDEGAPVVRVHPCAQLGPDDPYLNDSNVLVRDILRGLYPMWPTGGLPWGDVRDTAATIAAVVGGRGAGARAWLSPCHNLADAGLIRALREVTGRRLPAVVLPGRVMAPVIRTARPLQRALPARIVLPLPQEGSTELVATGARFDDRATVEELGVARTPLPQTLGETIAWMVRRGHLTRAQAGRAAA